MCDGGLCVPNCSRHLSLPLMCIDNSLFVCMVSLLVSYLDDNRYFLAIIYNATAAVDWSGHDRKPGPANQLMKTSTSSHIRAYFVTVPSPCSTKIEWLRDALMRSLGAPCLKKHKTRSHSRPTPQLQLPMAIRDEEEADKDAVRLSCSSRGGRRSYYRYYCHACFCWHCCYAYTPYLMSVYITT